MEDFFKNKKEQTDFAIAIAVILLGIGFILYQSVFSSNTDFLTPVVISEKQSHEPIALNIDGEEKIYVEVKERPRAKSKFNTAAENNSTADNSKIERYREMESTSSISSSTPKPKIEEFEVVSKPKVQVLEKIKETAITTIDTAQNYLLSSKKSGDVQEKVIQETEKPVEVAEVQTAEIITDEIAEDCIILLGAFSKKPNLAKLTQRLENDDYKVFKKPFKGLTRIGIFLPCDQDLLRSVLIDVKSKYAADAFVLKAK